MLEAGDSGSMERTAQSISSSSFYQGAVMHHNVSKPSSFEIQTFYQPQSISLSMKCQALVLYLPFKFRRVLRVLEYFILPLHLLLESIRSQDLL